MSRRYLETCGMNRRKYCYAVLMAQRRPKRLRAVFSQQWGGLRLTRPPDAARIEQILNREYRVGLATYWQRTPKLPNPWSK